MSSHLLRATLATVAVAVAALLGGVRHASAMCDPDTCAPSITVNQPGVGTQEGATAANSGTWSGTSPAVVSASIGRVIHTIHTWSWSLATTDNMPTQDVTVTVTDRYGSADVSFSLSVANVPPTATPSSPTSPQQRALRRRARQPLRPEPRRHGRPRPVRLRLRLRLRKPKPDERGVVPAGAGTDANGPGDHPGQGRRPDGVREDRDDRHRPAADDAPLRAVRRRQPGQRDLHVDRERHGALGPCRVRLRGPDDRLPGSDDGDVGDVHGPQPGLA